MDFVLFRYTLLTTRFTHYDRLFTYNLLLKYLMVEVLIANNTNCCHMSKFCNVKCAVVFNLSLSCGT